MKRSILSVLALGTVLGLSLCLCPVAQAQQGLNIGVVDMQECLNQYYKTKVEVEGVNAIAKEKQVEIDAKRADYEALTKKASDLDKKVQDNALGQEQRQAAFAQLQQIMQERVAKGREISEAERRAQQEIIDARQKMELTLVAAIREVVNTHSTAKGLDLVFDKSFLPKANKVILVTTTKVPDLTADVVAELNKNAPPGTDTTSAVTPGTETPAVTKGSKGGN